MMHEMMNNGRPKMAIVYPNSLAIMGLRQLLHNIMPIMEIKAFRSFDEFEASNPDSFFHYFVADSVIIEHRDYFFARAVKTIVLTAITEQTKQFSDFNCIYINTPEEELIRSFLVLEQYAHGGGKNLPPLKMPESLTKKLLTDREIEVLSLLVQGHINKEIASILHISLTTVITHRKNIIEKLGMKSVSALTIYAVTHGYVDINKI